MLHDFLSTYPAKLLEYLVAIAYLLLFVPFWRYLDAGRPARAPTKAPAVPDVRRAVLAAAPATAGWFQVPSGVRLHPGHTWARLEADGLVSVGIDDFAHKLAGPSTVKLPSLGSHVVQGEPALALCDEGHAVPLLSPVDGTVVGVNPALQRDVAALEDPYGAGWLFRVKPTRLAVNLRQLLGRSTALRLLEEASAALARRMSPELGAVLQDGGAPVHGIARALAGDDWERLAREHFLV